FVVEAHSRQSAGTRHRRRAWGDLRSERPSCDHRQRIEGGAVGGRFEGRSVIVTGAGQGMGRAIAARFARDGGSVLVAEVNAETAKEVADGLTAQGHRAVAFRVDVTDPQQVEAMVAKAVAEFGGVDVLVNNAGILRS